MLLRLDMFWICGILATYMEYDAMNFSDLFATELGRRLWAQLQKPETVLAMRVASKLRRPAVEAIGDDLLERFGERVRENRVKQMIGHMARQVIEAEGYVLDAQRIPIRFDDLFSSGSRYRLRA